MVKSKRKQAPAREALAVRDGEASHIERLARDPNIDVAKLGALIAMRREELARVAKLEFEQAFVAMQAELPVVLRRGRIKVRADQAKGREARETPFAKLEDLAEACRPVLARHGFAFRSRTEYVDGGGINVYGTLVHQGGHAEVDVFKAPADDSGSKNPLQARGSTTSYGRRYTFKNLTFMVDRNEDDDGVTGGGPPGDGALPQPAQRKSQQEAAGPVRPAGAAAAVERNVGTVAVVDEKGAGVLVALSTGFTFSTKNPELIKALRDHEKVGRVVRAETHASSDPAKYASILDELVVVSETVL